MILCPAESFGPAAFRPGEIVRLVQDVRSGEIVRATIVIALLSCFAVSNATAQLISPGKLSTAHADLEGITRCTNCHTLGSRGVDATRCLDCHKPLSSRVTSSRGYHANVEVDACGTCHKEHYGREFDVVRFDTTAFNHDETGFQLLASHKQVGCRNCHVPDNIVDNEVLEFKGLHGAVNSTFLGLATTCTVCHGDDSPHEQQFADASCDTCHDEDEWEGAPLFEHAKTAFKLTGSHADVACQSCHEPRNRAGQDPLIVYADAEYASCASCHEDVHSGSMGATCTTCHSTSGWDRVSQAAVSANFDHRSTGFPLVGRHDAIACASCHAAQPPRTSEIRITYAQETVGKTFPHPVVDDCTSCHVDYHDGYFQEKGGANCSNCHSESGWLPSAYNTDRHNREADFKLTGAHLATPCFACHNNPDLGQDAYTITIPDATCALCHGDDNPHDDQFAAEDGSTDCAGCHSTSSWPTVTSFDHDRTAFSLTGAHAATACVDCHKPAADELPGHLVYAGTSTQCATCHGEDDPHVDQFPDRLCDSCHDTESFRMNPDLGVFDHEQSRFPLAGAHENVACALCHTNETSPDGRYFVRFRPLSTQCRDCHDDER